MLAAAALVIPFAPSFAAESERPNMLFVLTVDQG